jgi:hypothetical protein
MTVRYIRVNPVANLFAPAIRGAGNIAIVGDATNGPLNTPITFTNPADAATTFPGASAGVTSPLAAAVAMALQQTPGPPLVYGVRKATGDDWTAALNAISNVDAQIIVMANIALTAATANPSSTPPGAIVQLARHVTTVSTTGGDGKERIGVAMLAKGSADPAIVAGELAHERMVYIAHKSDQDAAAAVAGVIAGYPPHVSLLLKPVNITTGLFTSAEIQGLNGTETFSSGPAGLGVNWLTDPSLIPGRGIYMGEGYTGAPGGKKYIDIVRTIDDISFRLKARLINAIGALRISRSGLRALIAQMEAELTPLVRSEVIEDFEIVIPILALLDKSPDALTDAELTQINNAQSNRVVEVLVAVDYAGAIHRLAVTLKFE